MYKTTLVIGPVFKNNIGVHFCKPELSGVNCNAWYEIPIPHAKEHDLEAIHPHIEKLFKAANLGVSVGRITRRQDLVVEYEPVPEGYKYVMTSNGYELKEMT